MLRTEVDADLRIYFTGPNALSNQYKQPFKQPGEGRYSIEQPLITFSTQLYQAIYLCTQRTPKELK